MIMSRNKTEELWQGSSSAPQTWIGPSCKRVAPLLLLICIRCEGIVLSHREEIDRQGIDDCLQLNRGKACLKNWCGLF